MRSAPLRVIIADDEPPARERLRRMLRAARGFELVGEAGDGPSAVSVIREQRPHIALLDIRLPGLSGFEVLAELGTQAPPAVIFVTAHREHAVRAFETQATDYLLKPFSAERLLNALDQARLRCRFEPASFLPELSSVRRTEVDRVALRCGLRTVVLSHDRIVYATAADMTCEVFTAAAVLKVAESLGSLERRLPADQFVRISRFALVNIGHVTTLEPKSHGDQHLVLRNHKRLTVTRTHRRAVLASLQQGLRY